VGLATGAGAGAGAGLAAAIGCDVGLAAVAGFLTAAGLAAVAGGVGAGSRRHLLIPDRLEVEGEGVVIDAGLATGVDLSRRR